MAGQFPCKTQVRTDLAGGTLPFMAGQCPFVSRALCLHFLAGMRGILWMLSMCHTCTQGAVCAFPDRCL